MSTAINRCLLTAPDPTARLRVFCFPHAGAGATTYQPWIRRVQGTGVQICPVQLPGRENRFREPAHDRLDPLLDEIAESLAPVADRPFAVFGHSLGALVAFGLTQRWHSAGGPLPSRLFVSGRIAPHLSDPRSTLHQLDDPGLIRVLRDLGGIPSSVLDDGGLMSLLLPGLRADLAVNETYRHRVGVRLPVPITAFGGTTDPKVSAAELREWRQHTSAGFAAHLLPGGHFFVQSSMPAVLDVILADPTAS